MKTEQCQYADHSVRRQDTFFIYTSYQAPLPVYFKKTCAAMDQSYWEWWVHQDGDKEREAVAKCKVRFSEYL